MRWCCLLRAAAVPPLLLCHRRGAAPPPLLSSMGCSWVLLCKRCCTTRSCLPTCRLVTAAGAAAPPGVCRVFAVPAPTLTAACPWPPLASGGASTSIRRAFASSSSVIKRSSAARAAAGRCRTISLYALRSPSTTVAGAASSSLSATRAVSKADFKDVRTLRDAAADCSRLD